MLFGKGPAEYALAGQPLTIEVAASLSCILDTYGKLGITSVVVPLAEEKGNWGKWEVAAEPSQIDDTLTFIACLSSEPFVMGTLDSGPPSLFVMCATGEFDAAFIVIGDYLGQGAIPVLTRFDGNKTETRSWDISPDGKAVIVPEWSSKFAKKLMMHNELFMQLTMRDQKQVGFKFDLRGASNALTLVSGACGSD